MAGASFMADASSVADSLPPQHVVRLATPKVSEQLQRAMEDRTSLDSSSTSSRTRVLAGAGLAGE